MNNISIIGLRLVAIYLIISGINSLTGVSAALSAIESNTDYSYLLLTLSTVSLPIVAGTVIWFMSVSISKAVCKGIEDDSVEFNDLRLVSAGTFLIGLYIVFSNIPSMYLIFLKYHDLQYGMSGESISNAFKIKSAELLIGLFLMFGRRFFVRAYTWLRYAG